MITLLQIIVLISMGFLMLLTFINSKLSIMKRLFWEAIWGGVIVMAFVPSFFPNFPIAIKDFTGTNLGDLIVRLSLVLAFYMMFVLEGAMQKNTEQINKLAEYVANSYKKEEEENDEGMIR